ncbi:hypothetical protein NCC49_004590 [Naganishia albida]|nr:hypothetical protein NCC49_004590 [Naganishia albida]
MSTQPLLPTHRTLSKGKGKAPAPPSPSSSRSSTPPRRGFRAFDDDEREDEEEKGRCVTIRFTGDQGGDLDVWVEEGESVGSVKEKIRVLRPTLQHNSLRFIHSGRLLTDGILLLPWLRALENRLQSRQDAEDIGIAGVVRGLAGDGEDGTTSGKGQGKGREEKVWLHCVVGAKAEDRATDAEATDEQDPVPNRRGFDSLLDAGFTPTEIAAMRREFYLSRGQEVPDDFIGTGATGDEYEEHVRALEEQWIEGDLNNETAETVNEGLYSSIFHGILIGFLFPLLPWFFFREIPSPNFFEPLEGPDAPLNSTDRSDNRHPDGHNSTAPASANHESPAVASDVSNMFGLRGLPGGDWRTGVVFGQRTQMAILIGTVLNIGFAGLRFLA